MIYVGIDPDISVFSIATINNTDGLRLYVKKSKNEESKPQQDKLSDIAKEICVLSHDFLVDTVLHDRGGEGGVCVIIEGQNIMQSVPKANHIEPGKFINIAQSLIGTATVSGMFLSRLCYNATRVELIHPHDWKGSKPKQVTQARAYKELGIPYVIKGGKKPYACPEDIKGFVEKYVYEGSDKINQTDFMDISDSIALALFCKKKYNNV